MVDLTADKRSGANKELIVASAAIQDVTVKSGGDDIVAAATVEDVLPTPAAAEESVVAAAAEHFGDGARSTGRLDEVISAAETIHATGTAEEMEVIAVRVRLVNVERYAPVDPIEGQLAMGNGIRGNTVRDRVVDDVVASGATHRRRRSVCRYRLHPELARSGVEGQERSPTDRCGQSSE